MRYALALIVVLGLAVAHDLPAVGNALTGLDPVPCADVGGEPTEDVVCYEAEPNMKQTIEENGAELGVEWWGDDWGENQGVTLRLFTLDGASFVVGLFGDAAYVGAVEVEFD